MDKVILLLSLFAVASGVDLETELKAQPPFCAPLIPATNVNLTWIKNTDIWYNPYVTKSQMFTTTKLIFGESGLSRMSEESVTSGFCFLMNFPRGDIFGFGKALGKKNTIHFNPIRLGVMEWETDGRYGLTSHFVLTDNRSYVVGVNIFPDGSRGGYVLTTEPNNYSEEQVSEWRKKFVEVGFLEESVVHTPTKCAYEFYEARKLKMESTATSTFESTTSEFAATPSSPK